MHAYLLALEIEPVQVNKVYVALPLHCTVVHWFRSDKTPAEILKVITPILIDQAPIEIISGEPDLFGREADVPVNMVENHETIRALHTALHEALTRIGIVDTEPSWAGAGHNPHVTRQRSGRFEQGRIAIARSLYLSEALIPDELQQKKVISKLFLKGDG